MKAVQVSLDGASRATFNRMRVRGEFDTRRRGHAQPARRGRADRDQLLADALQHRTRSAPPSTSPTSSAPTASTPAARCTPATPSRPGATSTLSEEQYEAFFDALRAKTEEYRGRMRVYFHEMGLLEELRYRLQHPAALLIVLPNGLVKLINALPFVCGDLRAQSLGADLGATSSAPGTTRASRSSSTTSPPIPAGRRTLHQWVYL